MDVSVCLPPKGYCKGNLTGLVWEGEKGRGDVIAIQIPSKQAFLISSVTTTVYYPHSVAW